MALAFLIGSAVAWDNGVARTPPLGYSNWNNFHNNKINSKIKIKINIHNRQHHHQ